MNKDDFSRLTLSSSYNQIKKLEPYLKKLQQQFGFNDSDFDKIHLAVNEAVTNAIVHGNKEQPEKKVYIRASLKEDTLQISVKDEGEGYDPQELPDPLSKEKLLEESGRGLFIIKQYTERLEFDEGATKLVMFFSVHRKEQ